MFLQSDDSRVDITLILWRTVDIRLLLSKQPYHAQGTENHAIRPTGKTYAIIIGRRAKFQEAGNPTGVFCRWPGGKHETVCHTLHTIHAMVT